MNMLFTILAALPSANADVIWKILTALGSLGMFLYGMSLMSGGLQKMAGDSLRTFIGKMTSNRFMGVLVGIGVTALVQSSTATTLLLVSFVNAGLMALSNAIGVIMGANIGTTVTAWIFALGMSGSGKGFSLGMIAVPIMFIGFILRSLKSSKAKNFGEFIFGFGFLFLGLSTLTANMRPLLDTEGVKIFLGTLAGGKYWSVLLFMVVGACLTLMMQSSAATMSITMALAMSGAIPFPIAAAMVLGENIGTTITSNIAAASANVSAKRTARAHMLFNLFGVAWVLCLYKPFLKLIGFIAGIMFPGTFGDADLASWDVALTTDQALMIPYIVAILHTLFNITNTCILIWFIPVIEKIVTFIVPNAKGTEEVFRLKYIKGGPMAAAELSLNEANMEIIHFAEICYNDFDYIKRAVNAKTEDEFNEMNAKLVKYEEITDKIEFEIASYLNEVSKGEISQASGARIKQMYKIIGEMESLGDSGESIGRLLNRKFVHKKEFDPDMLKKLNRMLSVVEVAYQVMIDNLRRDKLTDITNAVDAEYNINEVRNALREEHIVNIENSAYDYTSGVYYIDLISELEKIGDFIINISEARLASEN